MSNLDEISDETKQTFTELLMDYVGRECNHFQYWFGEKWDESYLEEMSQEDAWEDFRNFAFKDSNNNFWILIGSETLNEKFKVGEVMEMMVAMAEFFNDIFDIEIKMTDMKFNNEQRIWNTLAYWATYTDLCCEIREQFNKRWNKEIAMREKSNPSRTCDICYEAKQIFACCGSCKGKLLCKSCYEQVDNECPFCRRTIIYNSKFFRPFVKLDRDECKKGSILWVKSESKEEWLQKLESVCRELRGEYRETGWVIELEIK